MGITEEKASMESERTEVMISNIADGTGARILSNDEINAVAGGTIPWGPIALGVAAGVAAGLIYNSVAESNAPGWRYTDGRAGEASGGGAHESGPIDKE
jgi:hypothetical protein